MRTGYESVSQEPVIKTMKKEIDKCEITCGKFIDQENQCGNTMFKLYWTKGYISVGLIGKIEDTIVIAECQKCKGFLPIETDMSIRTNIRDGRGGKTTYKK